MIKCVCHPLLIFCPGIASNPCAKSIPNKPNAGMNNRKPRPADRFKANGLYRRSRIGEIKGKKLR